MLLTRKRYLERLAPRSIFIVHVMIYRETCYVSSWRHATGTCILLFVADSIHYGKPGFRWRGSNDKFASLFSNPTFVSLICDQ
jgi:hypothetical protein